MTPERHLTPDASPAVRSLTPAASAGSLQRAPLRIAGRFVCDASLRALTEAEPLAAAGRYTPVEVTIVRCGHSRHPDTVRGAHRFTVRFATGSSPGWTLHACSLPSCVHAPPPEPWQDGAPLAPWLWLMSDRALPRSLRMMQGFGTRTIRLVPAHGAAVFARFHWLPAAGTHALAADEAAQLAQADPQFLRRDLREALAAGAEPSWSLALQVFSERQAARLGIDPRDPGPFLPQDSAPLRTVGRLVLDRLLDSPRPDPAVEADIPGIETLPAAPPASPDDDLRHARLFWCSQSGVEQQHLAAACRAAALALQDRDACARLRARLALVDASLGEPLTHRAPPTPGPLPVLRDEVHAEQLAVNGAPEPAPMLSLLSRPGDRSVRMRRVALLLADGFDPQALRSVQRALRLAGARPQCVGARAGAVRAAGGALVALEASLAAAPSVLWDAVVLPAGAAAQAALARSPEVVRFVHDQYRHGKPILQLGGDAGLLARLGIPPVLPDGRPDPALLRRAGPTDELGTRSLIRAFLEALALPRRFDRGPACAPILDATTSDDAGDEPLSGWQVPAVAVAAAGAVVAV